MKFLKYSLILALMLSSLSSYSCDVQVMTRMDTVPSRGIVSSALSYAREHTLCILALAAMGSYIYVHSVLESMKPNPYEGPLKEAHVQIDILEKKINELNAAILFFGPLYKRLAPHLFSEPNAQI